MRMDLDPTCIEAANPWIADSKMFAPRPAGGDGGTTFFRSVSSDEDGGNLANIAASGSEQSNCAVEFAHRSDINQRTNP
jgi:hypothetical protein